MSRASQIVAMVALTVWWAPALAVVILRAAPQRAALVGTRYRLARAAQLIDRGRVREAGRLLAVLRREQDRADRRRAAR